MANISNHCICLGIPIPLSVQALPRTPPASFHYPGDLNSLQALKDFGKEFNVPCDEIEQACNLASGPADVVVILMRPKTRASHIYRQSFPQFVTCCRSLRAVDELIRFATNGARSIHTVTVLNAFSFKPDEKSHIPDERCHQLLAEILRLKKPKMIIRCHKGEYKDAWMKQFELPSDEYKFERKEIGAGENHKTTILQSFHPSVAVNYIAHRPEYRCLLIHHFTAAFAELSGVSQLHEEAEEIRQLCMKKSNGNDRELSSWNAPIYLTKALERRCGGRQGGHPIYFADETESEVLRRKAKILSIMYDWLEHLAGTSDTFGALGIAKAVVFLWKEHFQTNPLYKQVTTLLLFRGSEQQGWFPSANHSLPIIRDLSQLQISSSDFLGWTITVSYTPEIFEVNQRAVECISYALALEDGEAIVYCQTACNLIDKQSSLVNEYIRPFPQNQLSRALKIQRLATHCTILANIVKAEDYNLEEPKEKIKEDLKLVRFYLEQLISA